MPTLPANYNQDPGFFGTEKYDIQQYEIDPNAASLDKDGRLRQQIDQGAQTAGNRQAAQAQAATIATGQQGETRGAQMQLLGQLAAASQGQGPSVAQEQLRQAGDRNLSSAVALANTARGPSAGATLRHVSQQQGQIAQQTASDAAALRAQEVTQARAALGQLATGARGQDIALASEQGQMQQQTNLANLQSEEQQRQMNQQAVQFYLQQGMSLAQAQEQARMDMEKLKVQQNLAYNQMGEQATSAAAQQRQQMLIGGTQAAGSVAATIAKAL